MSITPRNTDGQASFHPFRRAMNDVFDSFERSFEPFGMGMGRSPVFNSALFPMFPGGSGRGNFGMSLDLKETDNGFELLTDLPGMRKEDITVDVDNDTNVLTVSGERKQEREEKEDGEDGDRKYHYVERSYGRASRSIRLPDHADVSKGSADYSDGVLRLSFPKRATLPPSSRVKIPIMGSGGGGGGGGNVPIEDGGSQPSG